MNFDFSNCSLKIQNSIRISILKMGVHLKVCGFIISHSFTFLGYILGLHFFMPLPWSQAQGKGCDNLNSEFKPSTT